MKGSKEQELKDRISKTKNLFEEMTGCPTSFKIEGSKGTSVYDEKSAEFVREKPSSQWMADNPKRWMADDSSEQRGEHVIIGVKASPSKITSYSQKIVDGKLMELGEGSIDEENRVTYIEESSSKSSDANNNLAIAGGGAIALATTSAYIIKKRRK